MANVEREVFMQINKNLVQKLIIEQYPQYKDLKIKCFENQGNDNRTFLLGSYLSIRFPTHKRYAIQVEKEHRWLPYLSKYLNIKIPKTNSSR